MYCRFFSFTYFIIPISYSFLFHFLYKFAVSFGGGNAFGARTEPISLSTLDRDCFIIPVHSLERFLPAGIPVRFCFYVFTLIECPNVL